MRGAAGDQKGDLASARISEAITLQFHPDWPHGDGIVIDSMAESGYYRSQFVTGTSNGGLTAFPGGDRWSWESRLFAERYDDASSAERPVYGAWNHRASSYGGAIRFGSSYVRLRAEAIERATFCFPDSVFEPVDVGEAPLLPHLCKLAEESGFDDLDRYVEAHVHGAVRFDTHVEAVVLDPSFVGTTVEASAELLGCAVEFHEGFRAAPSDFDPEYRGARVADLAHRLGEELTPRVIGDAARSGLHSNQDLKKVWHNLARFGRTEGGRSAQRLRRARFVSLRSRNDRGGEA